MTFHPRRSYRGDAPQAGSPVLERRYWPRESARDAEAVLTWKVGGEEVSIQAHLMDLSLRGAAVVAASSPPRGAQLRLSLAGADDSTVVGRVVAMRLHPRRGWFILHLKFNADCPRALFDRATGVGEDEEGRLP
jgi:hypothetical protein